MTIDPADIEQGSDEWLAVRLGKVTASRVCEVLAKGKGGAPSASRANYLAELVVERLTGKPIPETFQSQAMQRGKETEQQAIDAYTFERGLPVARVGFVAHPRIAMSGASPDLLVGDDGGAEFKCPNTATHLDSLRGGSIPKVYRDQILWNLACTGRQWWDFVSFDPRLPRDLSLHIVHIERNEDAIAAVETEVAAFLREVDRAVDTLEEIRAARRRKPAA